jgi:hypothetical protein
MNDHSNESSVISTSYGIHSLFQTDFPIPDARQKKFKRRLVLSTAVHRPAMVAKGLLADLAEVFNFANSGALWPTVPRLSPR